MAPRKTANSSDVSDDGDRIRARRERLGVDKRSLATEAGISRETLAAIEGGQGFRRTSLTKIERVLDKLEEEAGMTEQPPEPSGPVRIVVVRIKSEHGEVVVEGPVEDIEALEASAQRLLRGMRNPEDD